MLKVRIVNDETGTDKSANYRYTVSVNYREVAKGRVCGHDRADPWWKLLSLIAQDGLDNELPEKARR